MTTTSPTTETAAAVQAGTLAAKPTPLDPDGRFFAVTIPDGGQSVVIDLEHEREQLLGHPRRKTGAYQVNTAASFADYVNRHSTDATEIWADKSRERIVAVIDGHAPTVPGHSQHQATFTPRTTIAWQKWTALNRKQVDQATFAEHVEDRALDVIDPDGATLLEIAQTFTASTNRVFESSQRLSTGEVAFVYREDTAAKAGSKRDLVIPAAFTLRLAPYEGGTAYKVTARFRYRLNDGQLTLGFVLDRIEDVLDEAFADLTADITDAVTGDVPVLAGWPNTR